MADWRDDLLKEDSVFAVFRGSPSLFQRRFHIVVMLVAGFLIIGLIIYLEVERCLGQISWNEVAVLVTKTTDLGFNFSVALLGFLIAGFAIFSSITRPDLFIALAKIKNDDYPNLSELKFIFFTFMNTFVHFIIFSALCWFISIIFDKCGVLIRGCDAPGDTSSFAYGIYLFFFVVSFYAVALFLKLKSFLWNLYQTFLLAILNTPDA